MKMEDVSLDRWQLESSVENSRGLEESVEKEAIWIIVFCLAALVGRAPKIDGCFTLSSGSVKPVKSL